MIIVVEVCPMGKKLYESYHISPEKTEKLALTELCVLAQEEHEFQYRAVTQQYFSKDKAVCPTCGGTKTRVSKIVTRKISVIIAAATARIVCFLRMCLSLNPVAGIPTGYPICWPKAPSPTRTAKCVPTMACPLPRHPLGSSCAGFFVNAWENCRHSKHR